ncbi:MAG TPA: DinB family protein, partial [Ktedonobacterales bacterium]|nr:DinB family protein [Ktedonobacterales bacterium]
MNKTEVLRRIDDGWRRLTELVEGIDPTAFVQPVKDEWSPKDHAAHVAAWEEFLLAILEKRDRHRSMGVGDIRGKETDAIND